MHVCVCVCVCFPQIGMISIIISPKLAAEDFDTIPANCCNPARDECRGDDQWGAASRGRCEAARPAPTPKGSILT